MAFFLARCCLSLHEINQCGALNWSFVKFKFQLDGLALP